MGIWLMENWGSILALLVVAAVVTLAVLSLRKDKKSGKSSCGNQCSHCAMAGKCHQQKQY